MNNAEFKAEYTKWLEKHRPILASRIEDACRNTTTCDFFEKYDLTRLWIPFLIATTLFLFFSNRTPLMWIIAGVCQPLYLLYLYFFEGSIAGALSCYFFFRYRYEKLIEDYLRNLEKQDKELLTYKLFSREISLDDKLTEYLIKTDKLDNDVFVELSNSRNADFHKDFLVFKNQYTDISWFYSMCLTQLQQDRHSMFDPIVYKHFGLSFRPQKKFSLLQRIKQSKH